MTLPKTVLFRVSRRASSSLLPAKGIALVAGEQRRSLLHTDPPLIGHQRLWLNPSDRDLVAEHLREELDAAGWTLQPDDQISRGGCRVTSANGELDATWESRWAAVKAQVRHRQPQTEQPPGGHES